MSDPLTVYISGRVTGLPRESTEKKFKKAASLLYASNMNPVNPLEHTLEEDTTKEAMQKLLPVLQECDAIMMLADWEFSEGAKIEFQLAKYIGLHILFEEEFY
jgi:Domain of unknown function (DUF4406)